MAISVDNNRSAIDKLLTRQKLAALHVAIGKEWQDKLGLSDLIPATVVLDQGRIRVIHEGVLFDPVAILEADLAAVRSDVPSMPQ